MLVVKYGITKAKQQLKAIPLITDGCYIKQKECLVEAGSFFPRISLNRAT